MAFSTGGAVSGATAGSSFGPVGTVLGGIAGGFLGGSKKKSITLDPYAGMTPEQRTAMANLMNLGDLYNLSGFDFNMTPTELTGNNILSQYLESGTPQLDTATSVLTDMANTKFNPDDPSSGFAAYQRQVARATKDAADVLNRESAITGSRFGTAIGQNKADLAAQQSDILATKLAELYNTAEGRKLQAARWLMEAQGLTSNIIQSKLADAYQYGSLQRDLKNQQAQLSYDEWKRANQEKIYGWNSVLSKGTTPGLMSYDYQQPTQVQQMLNSFIGSSGGGIGDILKSFGIKQNTLG